MQPKNPFPHSESLSKLWAVATAGAGAGAVVLVLLLVLVYAAQAGDAHEAPLGVNLRMKWPVGSWKPSEVCPWRYLHNIFHVFWSNGPGQCNLELCWKRRMPRLSNGLLFILLIQSGSLTLFIQIWSTLNLLQPANHIICRPSNILFSETPVQWKAPLTFQPHSLC